MGGPLGVREGRGRAVRVGPGGVALDGGRVGVGVSTGAGVLLGKCVAEACVTLRGEVAALVAVPAGELDVWLPRGVVEGGRVTPTGGVAVAPAAGVAVADGKITTVGGSWGGLSTCPKKMKAAARTAPSASTPRMIRMAICPLFRTGLRSPGAIGGGRPARDHPTAPESNTNAPPAKADPSSAARR